MAGSLFSGWARAQSFDESMLFAAPSQDGSARYISVGGAFHALGTDLSSVTDNPAAAAVYLHDRFEMSLDFGNMKTESLFLNGGGSSTESGIGLPLIGLNKNFSNAPDLSRRWFFGFVLRRELDFKQSIEVTAQNPDNSIIDQWIANSDGIAPNDLLSNGLLYERMAWETYLTDVQDSGLWSYTSFATGLDLDQRYIETRSGRRSTMQFHLAGSSDHRWFYGIGIGIPLLSMSQQWSYVESGFDTNSTVDRFALDEEYKTDAVGFNIGIGVIYRPVESFRISLSYRSPSWFASNSSYSTNIVSTFRDGGPDSRTGYFNEGIEYSMTGAQRLSAGLAYVYQDRGFVSFSCETSEASATRIKSRDFSVDDIQTQIDAQWQRLWTYRLGTEWNIAHWALRGGLVYSNSIDRIEDFSSTTYSLGLGYDFGGSRVDLGWNTARSQQQFQLYGSDYVPAVELSKRRNLLVIGLGFAF
jgi:opacity protein-like surface antigen